jgi:glycosyltransferase involved in cell wall biosynthesis
MRDYVLCQGVQEQRVTIIENWADGDAVRPVMSQDTALRGRLTLGGSFVVAYSGNLGRAHEYATLLGAALALQHDDQICFLMTGGGAGMQELQAEVRRLGMGNFRFLPYQPRETLADCLGTGDVHLVSLRPELEGLVVPSKFYGILAAGRPTIFIGDPEGELSKIIRRFDVGYCVATGDCAALAVRLRELQQQPARRELMALRSRALFDSHYTLPRAVREWSNLLRKMPPADGFYALERVDPYDDGRLLQRSRAAAVEDDSSCMTRGIPVARAGLPRYRLHGSNLPEATAPSPTTVPSPTMVPGASVARAQTQLPS